jgi:hypothetical protein
MTVRGENTRDDDATNRGLGTGPDSILGGGRGPILDSPLYISADAAADSGDLWADVDADDLFDNAVWRELDLLGREEGDCGSQGGHCELFEPPDIDFSKSGGRRGGIVAELREELETTAEKAAYDLLVSNIELIFKKNVSPHIREKSLFWVFGDRGNVDNQRLRSPGYASFHDCVLALGAREIVIWTRIFFEMYLRWQCLPDAMPFDVVQIPDWLESEIAYGVGFPGIQAARYAWAWPGVPGSVLIDIPGVTVELLSKMVLKGYMVHKSPNFFFTGRNPHRLKQRVIWRDDFKKNERRALMNKSQVWEGRLLTWQALWPPK